MMIHRLGAELVLSKLPSVIFRSRNILPMSQWGWYQQHNSVVSVSLLFDTTALLLFSINRSNDFFYCYLCGTSII